METITIKSPNMKSIQIEVGNSIDVEKILNYISKNNIKAKIKIEENLVKPTKNLKKEALLKDLEKGLQEASDISKGKKKGKTLKEFLDYVK
jgi:hypothetical protein